MKKNRGLKHWLPFVAPGIMTALLFSWYLSSSTSDRTAETYGESLLALIDVNKQISIGRYAPNDLVELKALGLPGRYVRQKVFEPLKNLLADANATGLHLTVRTAYRSYATQQQLFKSYASKYGRAAASRFSAKPGYSEHQLGTTIDFGVRDECDLKACFAETPGGKWLEANAHKYGFALSYPKNSETISGYIHEPWHWRFIGIEAAHEWKKSGMILEQFLATKPQSFR